jgi:GNAT superfamily N-acetyltransferase
MDTIILHERDMTDLEFSRMNAGFDDHTIEHGNPILAPERHGFVALDGGKFVGCSSGLADKDGDRYSAWFYLTDLFVERDYRRKGLGARLLGRLEGRVMALGIRWIWTWTAGYEGPGFYKKQGYDVVCEMENYYSSGHSRIALRKKLLDDQIAKNCDRT